jgi:plastocyanin
MQLKTVAAALIAAAFSLTLVLTACGDDSGDDGSGSPADGTSPGDGTPAGPVVQEQPQPAQTIVADVTEPADGVVSVAIEGTAFANNNISVPEGEGAVIRVTNSDLVTHNLRIAGLDGEYFTEDDAITEPEMIAGGGSGELTFAPPVAGTFTFQCDFHPASMGGQITVR